VEQLEGLMESGGAPAEGISTWSMPPASTVAAMLGQDTKSLP